MPSSHRSTEGVEEERRGERGERREGEKDRERKKGEVNNPTK